MKIIEASAKHLPSILLIAFEKRHVIGHYLTITELKQLLNSPSAWVWVALDEAGKVLGFTSLKLMNGRWQIFITAGGSGCGKPLDQHREAFAKSQGAKILHGSIHRQNERALKWRLRLGYQIESTETNWFRVFKIL